MRRHAELLFWFHAAFIVAAVSTGLFLPLPVVLVLVLLHRAHALALGGCAISLVERHADDDHDIFLKRAARRFFGADLTVRQCEIADYALASAPLIIASLRA